MAKIIYEIEEERCFKQPTKYRVRWYRVLTVFWLYKEKVTPRGQGEYVSVNNGPCKKEDAFITESKEEVIEFVQFCIDDDNKPIINATL